jgi:hypothetical protein
MDDGLRDFLVRDGAAIEAAFERLHARVKPVFDAVGIEGAGAQQAVVLAATAALVWLGARRLPRLGYRIHPVLGFGLEMAAMGAVMILVALVLPSWVVFRRQSIEHAVVALFTP